MNKIKRSLAILLIIGLVITSMPINMASAAENNAVNGENTNITVIDDYQSDSNTATDDEQDETTTEEDTNTTDEGTNVADSEDGSAEIQLNYIYVESPKVATPGEQNIVVSLGDDFGDIENVKLNYQKDNGKTKSWESSDSADGAFLFKKDFTDADNGIYDIVSISFELNGELHEIILKEMGHEVHFGVNEEYKANADEALVMQNDGSLVEKTEADSNVLENSDNIVEVDTSNMKQVSNDVKNAIANQIGTKTQSSRSDKLIIYLDPGHDNTHTGSGYGSLREEKLNLQIAQYCRAELEQYSGVEVRMTRPDSGACPYPGTNKDQCLLNRIDDACDNGADAYVSIHLNASGVGANGAEVWYWYNNATGNGLANKIQEQLVALGLNDRGAKPDTPTKPDESDTYAVTRECKKRGVPGIIVEHAFMDGSTDYSFLSNSNNIKKLGIADANGIADFFNLSKSKGEWIVENGNTYYEIDGVRVKGLYHENGKTYYFDPTTGVMQTGWQEIDGKKYFFMPEGYVLTGWYKFGSTYYYGNKDGAVVTGLQEIDGKTYYFSEDGIRQEACWQTVEGKKYFLGADGAALTGWYKFGNTYYYGDTKGAALTDWQEIEGYTYYFGEDGARRTGIQEIDGEQYIFDSDGKLAQFYKISGTTNYTASDFVKLFESKNKQYPAIYASKGAATIEEFCQIYIEEANAEGIRAEVAFCQAMLETGWLRFGGDVKAEQCNFAGIGATGGGNPGNSFVDVRTGIRAQIQHLKAYANKEELNQECVDPRFGYVQRGSAPYVEWLGIPDNPNGGGWAGTKGYGTAIINLIKEL